jgi:hypothetical protein
VTPLVRHARRAVLPPVPSLVPIYVTAQTTTTNENTTVFTFDIGTPHPKREVVVGLLNGISAATTVQVNGLSPVAIEDNDGGTRLVNTHVFQVPNGLTAEVAVTATGSTRKAVAVWIYYPNRPFALSLGSSSTGSTTDATASLAVQAGGAIFYVGAQNATLGDYTTTWGGTESVVEDVDAQLEATSSYTMGHVNILTSSTNTLTLAESTSGSKQLSALVLGPAYGA